MSVSLKTDAFEQFPPKIVDSGVDWITCFRPSNRHDNPLRKTAYELLEETAGAGNDVCSFKSQGFRGTSAGGVSIGVRYDGYLVQLRGSEARDNWRRVMPHAVNISRLDIQSTYEFVEAQRGLMIDAYARARKAKLKRGRRPCFTLITSTRQGDTLNAGSRSSDIMLRMYDKGVESKQAKPGILIRQEVEYKRDAASSCARRFASMESYGHELIESVRGEFRGRGIITQRGKIGEVESARVVAQSDDARRLSYIRAVTSVMVAKVLRSYSVDEVLDALGLSGYAVSRPLMDDEEQG